MIRRHPHVFGTAEQRADGKKDGSWEQIKELERSDSGDSSALAGVTKALPALKRAEKLGKRASRAGFDWPDRQGVREKISEELDELSEAVGTRETDAMEEEFGDVLFSMINYARFLKVDPESALERTNKKFINRFQYLESKAKELGKTLKDMTLAEMDVYWNEAKKLK